ncbi:hypothetical protein K8T06_07055, partial [bacterium]|nr:hypothetical protein [bacterium]
MDKSIYNCHTHIFTHKHVPNNYFLNLPIIRLMRIPFLKKYVPLVLKAAIPWNRYDRLNRFAAFINAAFHSSQSDNFEELRQYYPDDTRFVVLPMDMSRMHAGRVMIDIDMQHQKLAELTSEYPNQIIPFAHIDPRRHDALVRLENMVENHDFKGDKIYPAIGNE